MNEAIVIRVNEESHGERVDAFLAQMQTQFSRARIQNLIKTGNVLVNNDQIKTSYRVMQGDVITLHLPKAQATHLVPQEIALDVMYEDEDLVVIDKPAGLVVHPGAGNKSGTLANALIHRFPDMQVKETFRPGLVHRLDKETSGIMVCARNDETFASLASQFKLREVKKYYIAFCLGNFKEHKFELITGHTRHKTDRMRYTTKLPPPKEMQKGVRLAHSRFEVLRSEGGVSELCVELLTGRTHQIRAHLADIHRPLLKDTLYSSRDRVNTLKNTPVREAALRLERHALHAHKLEFIHPTTRKCMRFEAKLPSDLVAIHDAMMVLGSMSV